MLSNAPAMLSEARVSTFAQMGDRSPSACSQVQVIVHQAHDRKCVAIVRQHNRSASHPF
jgi:hypothetical protein